MTSGSIIELSDIYKVYDNGVAALDSVTFSVDKGEFVFLTGTSGSGKTTLLSLISGREKCTSGNIYVRGQNITSLGSREMPYYRRTIGMVFQDFRLFDDRTVYENVEITMQIIGISSRIIRSRVPDILEQTGLSNKANMLPSELSGGEQQRIAIARAIANSPDILLADEPTGNLDPETGNAIADLFDRVNRLEGTTVIMATHAKDIADRMRKRIITLDKGCVVRDERNASYGV